MLVWAVQVSTLRQASVTAIRNGLNLLYQVTVGCSCQTAKPLLPRTNGNDVDAHLWHGHVEA